MGIGITTRESTSSIFGVLFVYVLMDQLASGYMETALPHITNSGFEFYLLEHLCSPGAPKGNIPLYR